MKKAKPTEDAIKVEEPTTVGAFQAKTELSRLLRETRSGKRFIITKRGKPIAELGPVKPEKRSGCRGDMKGEIWISEDFCAEIEDMKDYMG